MRLLACLATAAIAIATCGGGAATASPSPTVARTTAPTVAPTPAPTPTPANTFKADLKGQNQNPPITSPEASCGGTATVNFTGTNVKFDVVVAGCPASTQLNIAHIHEGATGVNGPVVVSTGLAAGNLTLSAGGVTFTRTVTAEAALISRIMANPAGFYFNIHSALHTGGVIRGQLTKA